MWALINETPFSAERAFAREFDGSEVWLVAIRATFTVLGDGSLKPSEAQEPVAMGATYWGEPGKSSLRFDSDLVLKKATTDVVLHGHAYAPGGAPANEVPVRMSVGPLTKTLLVIGDRVWTRDSLTSLSTPKPFISMPLSYERAFGGMDLRQRQHDSRNPIGRGFIVDPRDLPGQLAPNVQQYIADRTPQPGLPPAGFGPIAPDWSPRRELAGSYDATWMNERKPLVPNDFDDRFYQTAPLDQRTPRYLRGGEDVELYNLTPSGYLRFKLPRVSLVCLTRFGRRTEAHEPRLYSVIIEPDLLRVSLVWHASRPCHHNLYELKYTRLALKRPVSLGNPVVKDPQNIPRNAEGF